MKTKILFLSALLLLIFNKVNSLTTGNNKKSVIFNDYMIAKESIIYVTSISLDCTSTTLEIGEHFQLYEKVYPNNATNRDISWSSNNSDVASDDNYGYVTANSVGNATIKCEANDGSGVYASCLVTVKEPIIYVTNITLKCTSTTLEIGNHFQLYEKIYPNNATNKNVSWSSSNNDVASVDNYGYVTANSVGNAIIKCKANDGSGVYANCNVTVKEPFIFVSNISLNCTSTTLLIGGHKQLSEEIYPNNATNKNVSWSSSNSNVASVDNIGNVTAKAIGNATIRCEANDGSGVYVNCYVNVKKKGDLDGDDHITVEDITQLIELYLATSIDNHIEADMDDDGVITVDDITRLIELYLDLDRQITGVIVQGTYNPMYGTFNIPAGTNSNVLVAFYGKADTNYEFPSSKISYYADASVTKIAKLTDDDLAMISAINGQINGYPGTLISNTDDNAGKVYVTINPAGTDFSGTPVTLVNSLDEASGIELKNLKPVDKLLTFGYTRSSANALYSNKFYQTARKEQVAKSVANGLYAADAHLSKSDISKIAVKIDREKIATAFKNTPESTIATLLGTLYNQFNGILPALAVKADYMNAEGYTRSVYSNYGLATTAVHAPGFSPDFWNKVEQKFFTDDKKNVKGYYAVMNIIYKINKCVDTFIKETINPRINNNAIVKFLQTMVKNDIASIDIKPIDTDDSFAGKFQIVVTMRADDIVSVAGDDATINGRTVTGDKSYFEYDPATKKFTISFVSDISDLLGDMKYDLSNTKVLIDDMKVLVEQVNKYLDQLESYETLVENKIDGTIQKYLDKVNDNLANIINNISDRVQPFLLFTDGESISQLSGSLGVVKFVKASSITLYPTTYTAEVITPCYKKHIAVTNVYTADASTSAQDGDYACNAARRKANGENMNKVINGGIHQTVTLNLTDGFIYEVAYSALDYNGQIATRKFYVAKK
ncbi:MAG: Ig-like domain-containing protein [Bacteroidaceae bacterium]|nr:Ig-like domain-containing protein [Bacteroidaceae bacterium]